MDPARSDAPVINSSVAHLVIMGGPWKVPGLMHTLVLIVIASF